MPFTPDEPLQTKRGNTVALEDVLLQEASPGSGVFALLDLTNASVRCVVATREGQAVFAGTAERFEVPAIDPMSSLPVLAGVRYAPTPDQARYSGFLDEDFPLKLRLEWVVTFPDLSIGTVPTGPFYRKLVVGLNLPG